MTKKKKVKKFEECTTPEEQRCWLAQDVINSIAASKIVIASGSYLSHTPNLDDFGRDEELRDILRGRETPCHGCAMGSLFLCAIDAHDKLKVKDLSVNLDNTSSSEYIIEPYLRQWFSLEQLSLIEAAFEGQFYGLFILNRCDMGKGAVEAAIVFAEKRGKHQRTRTSPMYKSRMIAIMKNIIKHNGTFKPEEDV